jgi:hypothetical protein
MMAQDAEGFTLVRKDKRRRRRHLPFKPPCNTEASLDVDTEPSPADIAFVLARIQAERYVTRLCRKHPANTLSHREEFKHELIYTRLAG